MPGEGTAAGRWPGAAGGDRAEHSARPAGLESSDRPEGRDGVAHPGHRQRSHEEFHPIASLWPLLGEAELQELADDIKAHGLHNPIWRHRDGRIIDGRNRWLACRRAGIECPTRLYEGQDGVELIAFVVSLNDKRRHLTLDQRAAIAAEIANLGHGQKKADTAAAVSQPEAARLMGVSVDSVQRAQAVRRADPELHAKVKRGEIKAGRARAEVARKRGPAGTRKGKARAATVAPPPPAGTLAVPAFDGSARPPGTPRSGRELFEEIVSLRKESDRGDPIARLKELRSLDRHCHSGRRLELLDAHIDAQARFLAGLRSLREQLGREAAAREAGA